jgi:hypothetical protein
MSLDEDELWLLPIDVRLFELEVCPVVASETPFELAGCLFEKEVCLSSFPITRNSSSSQYVAAAAGRFRG